MTGAAANRRVREAIAQLEREVASGRIPAADFDIAIRRDGTWTYRGSPIARQPIVRLFASVLHRTADGRYWLVTPVERTVVHVEDVPFLGVELEVDGAGSECRLAVRTNLDERVPVDRAHPLHMRRQPDGSEAPYVRCRDGLDARLERSVFYELTDLAEPDGAGRLGVWSHGVFFPLGVAGAGTAA